jgi:formylglycine-generating enzyme required for sulfatase activity
VVVSAGFVNFTTLNRLRRELRRRKMKKVCTIMATVALLCLGSLAWANVFNLGEGFTNLETVTVGNAGNAPDTRFAPPGHGAVAYNYNIGKYEVTAAQYTDFLNQKAKTNDYGLYNTHMDIVIDSHGCNIKRSGDGTVDNPYTYSVADDWANRPVNYVSFWDACRFVNWLGNGQGNGDTETGIYTLNGYNDNDGRTILRNAGWTWAVASEDEWYKAGNTNAEYWDYATQSNNTPSNVGADGYTDPGNHANYYDGYYPTGSYTIGSPYYRTNVGEFENSASAYGTFDQNGNVMEWDEGVIYQDTNYASRGLRGGSFDGNYGMLKAQVSFGIGIPTDEDWSTGFRVSSAVPEPSSLLALLWGLGGVSGLVWRRKSS